MANDKKFIAVNNLDDLIKTTGEAHSQTASSIIEISEGKYYIKSPIKIDNLNHVIIRGKGQVEFIGGETIECNFIKGDDSIYSATIEKNLDISDVYVNDEKYTMARYPNYNDNDILNGYTTFNTLQNRAKLWKNPNGGYLRALHKHEWGGNSYIINGKKDNGDLELTWIGDNNRGNEHHNKFCMVENIYEELDSPKEWYYDRLEGIIYIIFPENTDITNLNIQISINSKLIDITNSSNISIENIQFKNTLRTLFNSNYVKITRSDWAIVDHGALTIEHCNAIGIKNCHFENIGGNCLYVKNNNIDININTCNFQNCGASGVVVFGNQKACRDLSTWENHKTIITDKTVGALNDDYPQNITVSNCYFYNLGIYEKQSAGVTVSVASNVAIKNCTLHHLPRAGINICDGNFGGHLIENNDIFDTVRETGDHGPFNSWGRDRFWSMKKFDTMGKYGKIKKAFALLDAHMPTIIKHNRIVGEKGFGIDLDDGSSNYKIMDNLCIGVGIKLREGFVREVKNNLIIGAPLDLHATFANNDDIIENNVVVFNKPIVDIIINKGYTTVLRNNLFVNASPSCLKNKLAKKYTNYLMTIPVGDVLKMQFADFEFFTPFALSFGKTEAPTPNMDINNIATASNQLNFKLATLCCIDESLRSMAGLADYNGLFVKNISIFSSLYFNGVRKGDVIVEINGNKINGIKSLKKERINSIAIVQHQIYKQLK